METELIFRSSDRKNITRSSCTKMQPGISSFQLRKMEWLIGHLNGKQEHLLYSHAPKKKLLKIQCVVMWRSYFPPFSHHRLGEKHHLGEKNKSVFFDSVLLCSHISRECNSSGLAAHICSIWYMQLQFHYPGCLFFVCTSWPRGHSRDACLSVFTEPWGILVFRPTLV